MHHNTSVYISFFHDYTFIRSVVDHVINFVDHIHFIDGPNYSTIPYFSYAGIPIDKKTCEEKLLSYLNGFDKNKFTYHFGIWENEREKRKFGYSVCQDSQYIMTIDADEIIDFNVDFLEIFIKSSQPVGGFDCLNMYTHDIFLGGDFYNYKQHVSKKNVLFDSSKISATRHLDYLWLINHKAEAISAHDFCNAHLGTMYHVTSGRSTSGKIVKSLFYRSFSNENCEKQEFIDICNKSRKEFIEIEKNYNIKNTLIGFSLEKKYFTDPFPDKRNHEVIKKIKLYLDNIKKEEIEAQSFASLHLGENWFKLYQPKFEVKSRFNLDDISIEVFVIINEEKPSKYSLFDISLENDYLKLNINGLENKKIMGLVANIIVREH